jgi:hypothetical protein
VQWEPRFAVLLDANLLLLFVVGLVDRERVGRIGRTDQFDGEAFDLLVDLVGRYRYAVTTPHVLTEVSDLLCKGANEPLATTLREGLHAVVQRTDERFVTARKLGRDSLAQPYGIADSAVIEAAQRGCTVLTVDLPLFNELQRRGLTAANFNHIRFSQMGASAAD